MAESKATAKYGGGRAGITNKVDAAKYVRALAVI
jgi:hypothetical protein